MDISIATTTSLANASNKAQVSILRGQGEQLEAVVSTLISGIEAAATGKGQLVDISA